MDAGKEIDPAYATDVIVKKHGNIKGEDAEWHVCCAYEYVRTQIRRVFSSFKVTEEQPDKQIRLAGFEYAQKYYLVDRNGKPRAIPIESMTAADFNSKITEIRAMRDGCNKHASELERYAKDKGIL